MQLKYFEIFRLLSYKQNVNIMKKPKLVIFDWDDTLAKTRNAVVKAMNYILKLYNLPEWDIIKEQKRDKNKSLKENFPNFFGEEEAKNAYQKYLDYYNKEAYKEVKKIDNADKFLEDLVNNNIQIAIISNKEKSLLLREVESCFPQIKFNHILGNGDAEHNKPAPDPVYKVMENYDFELNSKNVWLVGDTKQDTDCALNAKCQPMLMGKGKFMDEEYLKIHKEVKLFNSFEEIDEMFREL